MEELETIIQYPEYTEKDTSLESFTSEGEEGGANPSEYRCVKRMINTREEFLNLFTDAVHVDAVTYAESPDLVLELLEEYGVESLDILVGYTEEYRNDVDSKRMAEKLLSHQEDGNLTVRMKKDQGKIVHAKIYRAVLPDGTVRFIHGSCNFSKTSMKYHINQVQIEEFREGSQLDEDHLSFIDSFRYYSEKTFMESLRDADWDNDEEREELIERWVAGESVVMTDVAHMNNEAVSEICGMAEEVTTAITDPEEADKTVCVADEDTNDAAEDIKETLADGGKNDDLLAESPSNADVELVPSQQETALTDTLDRPHAKPTRQEITIGTHKLDDDNITDFENALSNHGATVTDSAVRTSLGEYTETVEEITGVPMLTVDEDAEQVVLSESDELVLVATDDPTPALLDSCLETIESYIELIDEHAFAQSSVAKKSAKAQYYETFIYCFWAPFVNQYAEALDSQSNTLTNVLEHLYLRGESDAGKDQLIEYILSLIADVDDVSGVKGEDVGVPEIKDIMHRDTAFPYATIDIEKKTVERIKPLRNYWKDWSPETADRPAIIFTTNSSLPKEEFRNRMKILNLEIKFPSSPSDPGYNEAQADLNRVMNRSNPIFSYVAREMLDRKPWYDEDEGINTVDDVRDIITEFYEIADREKPEYYPEDGRAEKTHSPGRIKWLREIKSGRITFEEDPNGVTAYFERERYAVHDFEKRLDKEFMHERTSGQSIYFGKPRKFADWIGTTTRQLIADPTEISPDKITIETTDYTASTEESAEKSGLLSWLF